MLKLVKPTQKDQKSAQLLNNNTTTLVENKLFFIISSNTWLLKIFCSAIPFQKIYEIRYSVKKKFSLRIRLWFAICVSKTRCSLKKKSLHFDSGYFVDYIYSRLTELNKYFCKKSQFQKHKMLISVATPIFYAWKPWSNTGACNLRLCAQQLRPAVKLN